MASSTAVEMTCSHRAGLLVGVGPREPEDVGEEALGQAVAAHDLLGQVAAPLRLSLILPLADGDEALVLHALDHLRHRRPGDLRGDRRCGPG